MITDKDIIIELLRQREDLQGKIDSLKEQQDVLNKKPDNEQKTMGEKFREFLKEDESYSNRIKELKSYTEELADKVSKLKADRDGIKAYSEKRIGELMDKVDSLEASLRINTEIYEKSESKLEGELDSIKKERDDLKKQYESLEYQRDDLSSVLKECNFPELKKLLNVPEGEILSTQLVKKVQELIRERDHWKSMQNMLAKKVVELRDKLELRDRFEHGVYRGPDQSIKQPPKNQ